MSVGRLQTRAQHRGTTVVLLQALTRRWITPGMIVSRCLSLCRTALCFGTEMRSCLVARVLDNGEGVKLVQYIFGKPSTTLHDCKITVYGIDNLPVVEKIERK